MCVEECGSHALNSWVWGQRSRRDHYHEHYYIYGIFLSHNNADIQLIIDSRMKYDLGLYLWEMVTNPIGDSTLFTSKINSEHCLTELLMLEIMMIVWNLYSCSVSLLFIWLNSSVWQSDSAHMSCTIGDVSCPASLSTLLASLTHFFGMWAYVRQT